MSRRTMGFSLVELLVCIAIIAILAAMYLPALAKARKQAEAIVVKEGFRQEHIGKLADSANIARPQSSTTGDAAQIRAEARAAFRRNMTMTGQEILATYLLWRVTNEAEFKAYWNTLINPAATGPIDSSRGGIVVKDEAGNEYTLGSLDDALQRGRRSPSVGSSCLRTFPKAPPGRSAQMSFTATATSSTCPIRAHIQPAARWRSSRTASWRSPVEGCRRAGVPRS